MRIAALVLGIIGGLAGIARAIFAVFLGGVAGALGSQDTGATVVTLGVVAILLSLLGIIGGALALAKPRFAGLFLLVADIGGFICISVGFIVGGPLLIVGGMLGLFARGMASRFFLCSTAVPWSPAPVSRESGIPSKTTNATARASRITVIAST